MKPELRQCWRLPKYRSDTATVNLFARPVAIFDPQRFSKIKQTLEIIALFHEPIAGIDTEANQLPPTFFSLSLRLVAQSAFVLLSRSNTHIRSGKHRHTY